MIEVDVVLLNMDARTAFCSDGVTRPIFEMYDSNAKTTDEADEAIAAVVKVNEDQFIILRLVDEARELN